MKANNYISKNEHKLLLIVAFMTFILAFANFASNAIERHNSFVAESQQELERHANKKQNEISFGYSGGWADTRPLFRFSFIFLTLFTFLCLRKTKRFIFSLILASLPFLIFIRWFIEFNHAINTNETKAPDFLERILDIATIFDYLVFFSVSILLFWQISILLRMLVKTT